MANKIKQYRYYNDLNGTSSTVAGRTNQPSNVTYPAFVSGSVFNGYLPIYQLGIQTLPGTKFYLNDSEEPILVGYTGIYELDLNNETSINKLTFSADSMKNIRDNNNAGLIIDTIYDDGEG